MGSVLRGWEHQLTSHKPWSLILQGGHFVSVGRLGRILEFIYYKMVTQEAR